MVTEIYMYVNWYIVCGYLNQSGFYDVNPWQCFLVLYLVLDLKWVVN